MTHLWISFARERSSSHTIDFIDFYNLEVAPHAGFTENVGALATFPLPLTGEF